MGGEVESHRIRKLLIPSQVVVNEKTGSDQPRRAVGGAVRQDKAQRPDDVGRLGHKDFALEKGLADQPEFPVLQIPETAVNQFAAGRRRRPRQIALFAEYDRQAAASGIAGDARSVDSAADHEKIKNRILRHFFITAPLPFPADAASPNRTRFTLEFSKKKIYDRKRKFARRCLSQNPYRHDTGTRGIR